MDTFIELFKFILTKKKYYLIPAILVVVIFGGIIVLSQGTVVAPFIYTLF